MTKVNEAVDGLINNSNINTLLKQGERTLQQLRMMNKQQQQPQRGMENTQMAAQQGQTMMQQTVAQQGQSMDQLSNRQKN